MTTREPPPWLHILLDTPPDEPEPAPAAEGEEVTPKLLEWISTVIEDRDPDLALSVWCLIVRRAVYGWHKYGTTLRTGDGRDVVHDAEQELGDLLQYAMSARMQGRDMEPIRRLLPVLTALLEES